MFLKWLMSKNASWKDCRSRSGARDFLREALLAGPAVVDAVRSSVSEDALQAIDGLVQLREGVFAFPP